MNTKKFSPYPKELTNTNFVKIEEDILDYWHKNNIFQKSIDNNPYIKNNKNNEFIFYDGPPFANGLPHYGHLLTGFIKDTYARYQTIQGKKVNRRFGWDCHGLPVEMQAEKELNCSGKIAIQQYGIAKFNKYCRESVMKYTKQWQQYVNRQARWVDFKNAYKTMDKNFMESTLWVFKELYKKGLIYKSMRVMPYSWACQTPLSNFETKIDNSYRTKIDKAITIAFTLKNRPKNAPAAEKYYILAWTTTPWTLLSNLALALNPDINYSFILKNNICYIIGSFAIKAYAKELRIENINKVSTIKGSELKNLAYYPLFKYFKNHANSFRLLMADFVTSENGTGIVHIAPGFGEDDYILSKKENISPICPVDDSGRFTGEIEDFVGIHVFDANEKIITWLKKQNALIKIEQYMHKYPHCWRTDTALIYKTVSSWYVKVTALKDRMYELNKKINWIPKHIKEGLFGNWLKNAKDWSISRNRFWGTPVPVWESDNPLYPRIDVYGSCEEIEKDFSVSINDLHKPFIDNITRPNPDDPSGKSMMRRVNDVFDCWFESGSMPYGQVHYPFENKKWLNDHLPADFIVEYSAQTRGWFYTLMVLSTALFDRPAFLNGICHGVILDSSGQKLSKRLNNYSDPLELFNKFGADALRGAMLSSNVIKGQELLIDKKGSIVHNTLRLFIKPIWNAYHFFCLYANIDKIEAHCSYEPTDPLDQYIISKLKISIEEIEKSLNNFNSQNAYATINIFFEVLNNWYIRRSRARFWQTEINKNKISAYNTLYTCIENIIRAISPLFPLITEYIYLGITKSKKQGDSVHLCKFPKLNNTINTQLVNVIDQIRDICSCALFIRNNKNIRIRQPLSSLTIITENNILYKKYEHLIKEEVNVKFIIYKNNLEEYADEKLVINFAILAKRIPKKIKNIISCLKQKKWTYKNNEVFIANEKLFSEEYELKLQPKESNNSKILSNVKGLVQLNCIINKELEQEGIIRDLVRFIQQTRKDCGFAVEDQVLLQIKTTINITNIINTYSKYIEKQTLSKISSNFTAKFSKTIKLNNDKVEILMTHI